MKKLLIFDLDGTLIDTWVDLKNAVNHALKLRNYPERSLEQIRRAIGNGVAKLVARSIPNGDSNPDYLDTLNDFKKYYSIHHSDNTFPYPNCVEAIFNLKKHGYILAVATNKISSVARILIERCYPGMFDFIQGDEPGMDRKPAPMMVTSLCQRFGVEKKDAFYIGDTDVDMQTALNSEVDFVLVTYGYRTKDELSELCKGKPTIDSLLELEEYLKSRF